MKKILTAATAAFLVGCGGGGSSTTATNNGGSSIAEPVVIDGNELTVANDTFYRYRMAATGCRLLIIPSKPLRSVYSYDSKYQRTVGDLRVDGNYLVTATESDKNVIIKLSTYENTDVLLANNCDGLEVPQIANNANEAGIYSLRPIFEASTQYISSTEQDKMVFVYDDQFNITNSGQYFVNTTNLSTTAYFYSNAPFSAAFASESVGL